MFPASGPGQTTINIPGYFETGLQGGLPAINDLGAKASAGISNQAIGSFDVSMALSGMIIFLLILYLILKYVIE